MNHVWYLQYLIKQQFKVGRRYLTKFWVRFVVMEDIFFQLLSPNKHVILSAVLLNIPLQSRYPCGKHTCRFSPALQTHEDFNSNTPIVWKAKLCHGNGEKCCISVMNDPWLPSFETDWVAAPQWGPLVPAFLQGPPRPLCLPLLLCHWQQDPRGPQ